MHRRKLFVCAAAFLFVAAWAIVAAPPARAGYGPTAVWQWGISGQCVNPSLCGGIFGFWGWVVLNSDGTGEIVISDYGTSPAGQPVNPTLRDWEITLWDVPAGIFVFESAVLERQVGPGPGFPMTFPFDTGVPAAPGHYQSFAAPGFIIIFEVAQVGVGG